MPRKQRLYKRMLLPDPKFEDMVVSKFINTVMKHGKKGVAERAVYGALDLVAKKGNEQPLDMFQRAIGNVRPLVEVRSRRVGGATYQVPTEVNAKRGQSLAIRWIVECANLRGERTLMDRLAAEIFDASANRGGAMKKREDTHKMADANKAFAHFKW